MFDGNLAMLDATGIATESEHTAEELIAYGERLLRLGRELQASAAVLRGERPPKPVAVNGPGVDHSVGRFGEVDENSALAKARELGTFTRIVFEDALGLDGVATSKWLAKLLDHDAISRVTDETGAIAYRYIRSLEDEPPGLQLRVWVEKHWAQSDREPFDLAMVAEGTGLAEEEAQAALVALIADGTIAATTIEVVNDLDEIEKLRGQYYEYRPPIPGGLQTELERRRLAEVGSTPQVKRGEPVRIRTERKNARARSTPGSRQKVINQDRNWERLQAAKAERAEKARARPKQDPKARRRKRASKPVQ